MKVIKRSGAIEDFNITEIINRILNIDPNFNLTLLLPKIYSNIYIENRIIKTSLIDTKICDLLNSSSIIHPHFGVLVKKLYISNLIRMCPKNFNDYYLIIRFYMKPEYTEFIDKNISYIESLLVEEDNYKFTYMAVKILEENYLFKVNNEVIETPILLFMRTAIQLCNQDLELLKEIYTAMIEFKLLFSTPTLYNSCLKVNQLSACYLQTLMPYGNGNELESLFDLLKESALIASTGGGIGVNLSQYNVLDCLPFFNDITNTIKQSNKRRASIAIYLDIWHKDIKEFISMRSHINGQNQTYDKLFSGVMIPDIFMKRLKNNEYWTLLDPKVCPKLFTTHSNEFENAYLEYEKKYPNNKIRSLELLNLLNSKRIETGVPYVIFRDTVNQFSNENNIGIIQNSNLCSEIMQVANENTAVCNLCSLGLNYFFDGEFNFKEFQRVIRIAVKAVNVMVDKSHYPYNNVQAKKTRAVGIGVRGLADLFISLKLPFTSTKAQDLNKLIFEHLYYYSLDESSNLAKIHGSYEFFNNSNASKGILHVDHYKTELTLDWDSLKDKIISNGLRNSLLVALMPTATTSLITNSTESFEPITELTYVKQIISGNFQYIHPKLNEYLDKDNIKEIILNKGSIQDLNVDVELKELFKTVYEIPQELLVKMAIDRAPFIDQSQSLNLYFREVNHKEITQLLIDAWKGKLKTASYYIRTKAIQPKIYSRDLKKNSNKKEYECMSCSS